MTTRTKPRTALRTLGLVLASLAIGLLAACSPDDSSQQAKQSSTPSAVRLTQDQLKNVGLFTVAQSSFHKVLEVTGIVDFDNDQATSVLAPFSGPVSRLLVSPGEKVKKSEVLAYVDSPDFAAAVSAYRKALATAQTARRLADQDKDLLAHNGVSQREAEQAETDAVSAEADSAAARQALVALNVDPRSIEDVREGRLAARIEGAIRAPIAGTVVEKLITPGELLTAGTTPCFTVADLSRVWVMAQVFGPDLALVHVGDGARVETALAGRDLEGRVDNIAAEIDPDTRSVAVRVAVDNPNELLKKQMYVRVRIESATASSGLLVPVSAILRDDENLPFVYVAQRDGSFVRRRVTVGDRSGNSYDITDGLAAGERIVVDGGIFVQFMQDQ